MRILFLVRHTFDDLGGGDKVQVLKTKEALESLGHSITISTSFVHNLQDYDVVHMFNMMIRPHAYFIYLLHAKRANVPVALSTIYWNPEEWLQAAKDQGFEATQEGTKEKINPFDGVPMLWLVWYMISSRTAYIWLWLYIQHRGTGIASKYIRDYLVSNVDIILPNGESEGKLVQHDFAKAKDVLMVPNGVDDMFRSATKDAFVEKYGLEDFVLHVGRIESRKNLLPVVRAVKRLKLPLVLIGNDAVEPAYAQAVKEAAPKHTLYIAEIPHEDLASAYKAAKVHALASWFETPGLASLEAGLAGCNVVTTDRGTTKEYFEDLAWYCNPSDGKSIEDAIAQAFASEKSENLREHILHNFTWADVAKKTLVGYERIIRR